MNKLINDIKKYTEANYDCGYDCLVECWDDSNYSEWIVKYNVKTLEEFIDSYAFMIDHQDDIKASSY